jgi:thiamine pyrophosphate-dependent acetolactate synthase large subunit-like protein
MWTQVIDVELPQMVRFERPAGGEQAIAQAAELLSNARFPVILSGAGVVLSGAIPDLVEAGRAARCARFAPTTSTMTASRDHTARRRPARL